MCNRKFARHAAATTKARGNRRLRIGAWIDPNGALRFIKRYARKAGLSERIGCHTYRATGIATYLKNGGTLLKAAQIAAHETTRTTQLYYAQTAEMCSKWRNLLIAKR